MGLEVGRRALTCKRNLKLPIKVWRNEWWRPAEYFQVAVFKIAPKQTPPRRFLSNPRTKERSEFLEPFRGDRKFHIT